jgi:hypothetical protein
MSDLANIEHLEADLWDAADNLRANSKLTAGEYCMPVLFAELGWTTVSGLQKLRRTRDPAAAGLPRLLSGQVELKAAA